MSMIPFHPGPYRVPPISDGQLRERASMIRLVHERITIENRIEDGEVVGGTSCSLGLWWIATPREHRSISYTWAPDWIRSVEDGEIVAAKTVLSLHIFGYRGMFKPSLAEVLAFAPDNLHDYYALSIQGPETAEDLNANLPALNAGFHVAEVTYYRRPA